jgi:hypothetical protein
MVVLGGSPCTAGTPTCTVTRRRVDLNREQKRCFCVAPMAAQVALGLMDPFTLSTVIPQLERALCGNSVQGTTHRAMPRLSSCTAGITRAQPQHCSPLYTRVISRCLHASSPKR